MGQVRLAGADGCLLKVFTESGVLMYTQNVTNTDETIRLEHLPTGVYFFCIEKDKQSKTVKVIKD
jgi:protein subunit release factor A